MVGMDTKLLRQSRIRRYTTTHRSSGAAHGDPTRGWNLHVMRRLAFHYAVPRGGGSDRRDGGGCGLGLLYLSATH